MNLQELADYIVKKNDEYFPGWDSLDNPVMHSYWTSCLAGEAGELCNVVKKYLRGVKNWEGRKISKEQLQEKTKEEIADIFIYLVLYSRITGIDMTKAVMEKVKENYRRFGVKDE